jgi:lysophospholipase L1-like esterase
MTKQSLSVLRGFFRDGDIVTESAMTDLIDTIGGESADAVAAHASDANPHAAMLAGSGFTSDIRQKVIQAQIYLKFGTSIAAYYPMLDKGSVLTDVACFKDGTINGPTPANTDGPFAGELTPSFSGASGGCNIFAGVNNTTPSVAGAVIGWSQTDAWADGASRSIFSFYRSNNDFVALKKSATPNQLWPFLVYGGVNLSAIINITTNNWFCWAVTWDKGKDTFNVYFNGYDPYVTKDGLGVLSGGWLNGYCNIGEWGGGVEPWSGSIAHVVLLNRKITRSEFQWFAELPNILPVMTMIGDSIETQWNGWQNAVANSKSVILKNHAVGGYGIVNGGLAIEVGAAAVDRANVAVIVLGANDDNAGNMTTLQAEFEVQLVSFKSTNPDAKIYVIGTLPAWTNNTNGPEVDKSNIRTALHAGATAYGATYVDARTLLLAAGYNQTMTSDGTHPVEAGHVLIATTLSPVLVV